MSTQPCARCGAAIHPSEAVYSSDGLVCDARHAVTDRRAARFSRALLGK